MMIFKAVMKELKRLTYSDATEAEMKPTCYTT